MALGSGPAVVLFFPVNGYLFPFLFQEKKEEQL
jgi:hypothetical protein